MHRVLATLLADYKADPRDEKFPERATAAIFAYKPRTAVPSDLVDPSRIRTNGNYLSKLKWQCYALPIFNPRFGADVAEIQKEHPHDDAWSAWNECKSPADYMILQKRWRAETDSVQADLAAVEVAPAHLRRLGLTAAEMDRVNAITTEQKRKKLDTAPEVDVDKLMETVMPGLKAETFNPVIVALLLATGRREVEILATGSFTKIAPYRVTFTGHAKSRGAPAEAYPIDLLAPADDVIAALAWVRANIDTRGKTNVQINSKYSGLVNRAVTRATKLSHAHMLRGLNAVACHKLWGGKRSMIAYLRQQLGHASEAPSTVYSAWEVTITKPWGAGDDWRGGEGKAEEKKIELRSYSNPSAAKAAQVLAMMKEGLQISAKAVIKMHGGSPALVRKLLDMNSEVIAAHNAKVAAS